MRIRVASHTWAVVLAASVLAGCGIHSQASLTSAHQASQSAKSSITIADGQVFKLPVPTSFDVGRPVSVADTQLGILYILPPHWLSAQNPWQLWLAPATGASDISRDSVLVAQWHFVHQTLSIADVTQNVALIVASPTPGIVSKAALWSVNLETGSVAKLHTWNPSQLSGPPFVSGRGVAAWWNPGTATATTLNLVSGARQTLVGVASAQALSFTNGGLAINGTPVALPFLKPYNHTLPKGYQWAYPAGALNPIVAVPKSWIIRSFVGQNSIGITASNPSQPSQHMVASLDACVACFSPANNTGVSGPDSPLLGVPVGTKFVWLSDHAVAYTLPGSANATEYKLQVTEPNGGVVDASVTLPASLKREATTILNSLWWP